MEKLCAGSRLQTESIRLAELTSRVSAGPEPIRQGIRFANAAVT